MIKKLIIRNFRSIRELELNLAPLNAFIGPNNAGKSNILTALNLILGETYPSVRSFDMKDFYNYDTRNPIEIKVIFDNPLTCNSNVYGFYLFFNGNDCNYYALDVNGDILTYSGYNNKVRVSNVMKEEKLLLYIGLDRQAAQQLRPTQWTLFGKLLKNIEMKISEEEKTVFKEKIENIFKEKIFPYLTEMEEKLRNYVKEQTGLDLNMRLSIQDPVETIKYLRPYLIESENQEFDAEDMGAGIQSALTIAIARVYAEIVRQPLMIAIEEPELYLHPHGCRHFYKLLKELSDERIQIFYTTHERAFVNLYDFESIHIVRKNLSDTKVFSGIGNSISDKNFLKHLSKFSEESNEVFFANKVVLVEGPADKIACVLALERLNLFIDKEGISIVDCGSITAIKPIAEVLKIFGIPVFALVDEDPGNPKTASTISELKSFLGGDKVFLQSPKLEELFGLNTKPNRNKALEIFSNYFNNNENKIPEVYMDLKKALI